MVSDSDKAKTKKPKTRTCPATAKKKTNITTKKQIVTLRPFAEVDAHVCEVLFELMASSASDSVRVAAAKALMEKFKKGDEVEDDKRQEDNEHAAAVLEAQMLLDAIAKDKSSSTDCAG